MLKSVYIETSVPSYLTARPSRDLRVAAWQQVTEEWWRHASDVFELFMSELTLLEAAAGNSEAAARRLEALADIPGLRIDTEARQLAERLIADGGIPVRAQADALHVAVAAVHGIDYLLTWNCRHINNAAGKPAPRKICDAAGYRCPEICTPMELLPGGQHNV